ncbi:hypothetical protein B9Z55_012080 [Caenorhabditis nigoni]|uniref:Neurotransmitter-gated ion-channel ligand-binding domain-containing protein n=1 Tax=Caenorhabditis nigoni TaxID=1611254 RepID=A0A2G5TVL2_9PELO|nr:hypothetical protein B9Z55_012080 [Caenorhabditis nigoni]
MWELLLIGILATVIQGVDLFYYNPGYYVDVDQPIGYDSQAPKRWNYTVFLYYLKLVEVQEPEEKVSVVMELMEYWYDARLSWNTSLYHNTTSFYARQDNVWSPTLTVFGVNDIMDFRDQDNRMVAIDNFGFLWDYISVRISANCQMDVSRFPFDTQTCQIRFCLPIFYRVQVEILNEIYEGIMDENIFKTMGNSEWKLINLTNRVEVLKYNDNMGNMDLLNVGLTNIMTMTFILGVMADKIPRTGNIPLLGIYIILNLVIMLIAIAIVTAITELRRWATPKLKMKRSALRTQLEIFLGPPLEYTSAIILELMTCANFLVMVGFWFDDGS